MLFDCPRRYRERVCVKERREIESASYVLSEFFFPVLPGAVQCFLTALVGTERERACVCERESVYREK